MSNEKQRLIEKFNQQQLSSEEHTLLERLIEAGEVDIEELSGLSTMQRTLTKIDFADPSRDLDDRFYQMLALQKKKARGFDWKQFFTFESVGVKLALASVMLIIGVAIGYVARPAASGQNELQALSEQVVDLKEMMMLSLLEKESASERLKAVSLTQDMDEASSKVTNALIKTLNEDDNVNVRLAALEALTPYVRNSNVRQALIASIAKQDSPLVQIAMAELMVSMSEKSSVKELEKIVGSEKTPSEVKTKIRESIKVLI
jgi:hypothetical protein